MDLFVLVEKMNGVHWNDKYSFIIIFSKNVIKFKSKNYLASTIIRYFFSLFILSD